MKLINETILYLGDGFVATNHFVLSVEWLESCDGLKSFKKLLEKRQVREVTAKLDGSRVPTAPTGLQKLVDDVKLKNFKSVDVNKAKLIAEYYRNEDTYHPNLLAGPKPRAMAFQVKGESLAVEIDLNYFSILTLDPTAQVLAKRFDKPIAVTKNGKTVALVMPMMTKQVQDYLDKKQKELQNGKL